MAAGKVEYAAITVKETWNKMEVCASPVDLFLSPDVVTISVKGPWLKSSQRLGTRLLLSDGFHLV